MTFLGFLVLFDPPKPNIAETIASLKALGVSLKIITGDNRLVAASLSQQMGLPGTKILAGPDLHQLSDGALLNQVVDIDVFAEIEPNQKERIILALKKAATSSDIWATASTTCLRASCCRCRHLSRQRRRRGQGGGRHRPPRQGPGGTRSTACARDGDVREHTEIRLHGHQLPISATCSAWPRHRSCCPFCPVADADTAYQSDDRLS